MNDEETLAITFDDKDYLHSKERLFERYGIDITTQEYSDMILAIMNLNLTIPKIFYEKKSNRLSEWFLFVQDRWIPCYYDKNRKRIRTILSDRILSRVVDLLNLNYKETEKMILTCVHCKPHEFQDETYGYKMRVHNMNKTFTKARCTVCGDVKNLSSEQIKEKKSEQPVK